MDIGGFIGDIIAAPFVCIGWLIVGLIAGALARRLMGSPDRFFVMDIILGLLGAVVGGLLASLLLGGYTKPDAGIGLWLANIVIATVGAVVLIAIRNVVLGRPR
jgi:uncharacterized membrane protein YeaQ/YmgE (transglycosylase-associated protein family)